MARFQIVVFKKGRGMVNEISDVAAQDAKNMALLIWVGTIFFGFIPSLIIYLVKKDDSYVQDQAKEALNWSITALIGYLIVKFILPFPLVSMLLFIAIAICNLVFCILGAVGASSGSAFRVPFALRLIK